MREFVEKMLHSRVECEPIDVSGLPLYLRGGCTPLSGGPPSACRS